MPKSSSGRLNSKSSWPSGRGGTSSWPPRPPGVYASVHRAPASFRVCHSSAVYTTWTIFSYATFRTRIKPVSESREAESPTPRVVNIPWVGALAAEGRLESDARVSCISRPCMSGDAERGVKGEFSEELNPSAARSVGEAITVPGRRSWRVLIRGLDLGGDRGRGGSRGEWVGSASCAGADSSKTQTFSSASEKCTWACGCAGSRSGDVFSLGSEELEDGGDGLVFHLAELGMWCEAERLRCLSNGRSSRPSLSLMQGMGI